LFAEFWKNADMDMETWKHGDMEMETWKHRHETGKHGEMETWTWKRSKRKKEARAIFLNPFNISSSCTWKFFVFLFVDEETNGCYLFANGPK
jgi:hypothetical protein